LQFVMFSRNTNQAHFSGIEISFISIWVSLFWSSMVCEWYCSHLQWYWVLENPNSSIFVTNLISQSYQFCITFHSFRKF
jgi:hypothetical protein